MTSGTSAQPGNTQSCIAGRDASAYPFIPFAGPNVPMSMNIELARHNMVEQQVRPWDVLDSRVLEALTAVPREDFVPPACRNLAFADLCLPLGHDEVMM